MGQAQSILADAVAPRLTLVVDSGPHGRWIVKEIGGLVEATFIDRSEAVRFARFETGYRPGGVLLTPFAGGPDQAAKAHKKRSTAPIITRSPHEKR